MQILLLFRFTFHIQIKGSFIGSDKYKNAIDALHNSLQFYYRCNLLFSIVKCKYVQWKISLTCPIPSLLFIYVSFVPSLFFYDQFMILLPVWGHQMLCTSYNTIACKLQSYYLTEQCVTCHRWYHISISIKNVYFSNCYYDYCYVARKKDYLSLYLLIKFYLHTVKK